MSFARRAVVLAAMACPATPALAGPLDPPPGPITPTAKPLAEIEPRIAINAANTPGDADSLLRISQPGSYYLTANVTGVSGKSGIEIAAAGVTLDLAGFELVGVPGSLNGIATSVAGLKNIEIRSGLVRAWGGNGINTVSFGATGTLLRDLRVSDNGLSGITSGECATIVSCVAIANATNGILASSGCIVTNCVARLNGADGIDVTSACVVSGCVALDNADDGFEANNAVTILNCAAFENAGNGINATSGCTISGCTAFGNTLDGISAGGGCTVTNNACRNNQVDGIAASSGCLITGNTCTNNGLGAAGGAGIHLQNIDNRVEGNLCTLQDRGIHAAVGGNIIIRNTCSGNTVNWEIVANNYYGPIINRLGVLTVAVSGDAAGSTLATTDPHANFTY